MARRLLLASTHARGDGGRPCVVRIHYLDAIARDMTPDSLISFVEIAVQISRIGLLYSGFGEVRLCNVSIRPINGPRRTAIPFGVAGCEAS
jgi:hypothetical protein